MFSIKDNKGLYYKSQEDQEPQLLYPFLPEEKTSDSYYNLYCYAGIINGNLYVKFGEAIKQSCLGRNKGTDLASNYRSIIALWHKDVREGEKNIDTPIHHKLMEEGEDSQDFEWAGKSGEQVDTKEAYLVKTVKGLEKILEIISEEVNFKPEVKSYREPWADVMSVVDEVVGCKRKDFILDLCTRWGKTSTVCNIILKSKERVNIMCSYVGTVRTSYSTELASFTNYNNVKFIDPDNYESSSECIDECLQWLNESEDNKLFYYLALTGDKDSAFDRRSKGLDTLKNFGVAIYVEEADFGATRELQAEKISLLKKKMKYKKLYFTTGTSAEKCESLTKDAYRIYRDYIADVLSKRKQGVAIAWNILNNHGLVNAFEDYEAEVMENFTEIFTVEDGHLKGEAYLQQLIAILYQKQMLSPRMEKVIREWEDKNHIRFNDLLDYGAATMIFTAGKIEAHEPLKEIILKVFNGQASVAILNGDETTNKEAENKVKNKIKNANGKPVFIISSGMAMRSFSIPQIKNIILLTNGGNFATVQQKIARGLTPWNEFKKNKNDEFELDENGEKIPLHPTNHIIDFRLSYANDCNAKTYLEGMATNKIDDDEWTDELIAGIEACGKVRFNEYFLDEMPIKPLTVEEMRQMMETMSYEKRKACYFIAKELPNIREPKVCNIDIKASAIKSSLGKNLTGTSSSLDHMKQHKGAATEEEKAEKKVTDKKLQHLLYLLDNVGLFFSGAYDDALDDILNMSAKREKLYADKNEFDTKTMKDIAKALKRNHVSLNF